MSDSATVPTGAALRQAIEKPMPSDELTRTFGGKTIDGDVDLTGIDYPHRLELRDCTFRGAFTAEDCRFGKSVDLTGCTFEQGIDFAGTHVGGNLRLGQVLAEDSDGARQSISLDHVRVDRDLWLVGAQATELVLMNAQIAGDAVLNGAQTTGDLNLQSCEIGGSLFCRSQRHDRPRTEVGGKVWMSGAVVGGDTDFSGSKIIGDLILEGCQIGDNLYCKCENRELPQMEVGGDVSISGATVGGSANFGGAKISGGLNLQSCEIGGSLFCRSHNPDAPRTEFGGEVWMSSATVASNVEFGSADIQRDVLLLNSRVGGDLHFSSFSTSQHQMVLHGKLDLSGTRVEGETSLVGVIVRGGLEAIRAEFDDGFVIQSVADSTYRTTIGDDANAKFRGINLAHSRFNAKLSLSGCEVHGPVNLHAVQVQGDIDGRSTKDQTTRLGPVNADNAQVTGSINFTGVEIARVAGKACLNLSFADVQGDCRLPASGAGGVAHISLYHAKLGELRFGSAELPAITADGMAFRRLQFGPGEQEQPLPDGENAYVRFLDHTHPFQKGVYRFVEKHLRDRGQDEDADLVFREMLRRDRRDELRPALLRFDVRLFEGRSPRSERLLPPPVAAGPKSPPPAAEPANRPKPKMSVLGWARRVFLDVTTGNGTRSHRISGYLLFVFVFLFWLFGNDSKSVKRATMTTSGDGTKALADHKYDRKAVVKTVDPKVHPDPDEWKWWEPSFMAFRVTFPMLKIITGKEWEPSDEKVDYWLLPGWKYETYAGLFSTLSYLAVPLFLVSVSGFLKRRGE